LWIGLRRTRAHGPFERWTAGDKLGYTNWNPGEPNDWGGGEECTHILNWSSRWNDIACGHHFYGVVEIPTTSSCGISAAAPALGVSAPVVVSNPTATTLYWRLNGNVNDLSGNGMSASMAGSVSWKTESPQGPRNFLSQTPSAYFIPAAYPQIYFPNSPVPNLSGDASFTMMVWAYYDSAAWPSDWIGVFGTTPEPDVGNFNNGVGLAIYQGNLCLTFYGTEVSAKTAITTKTWYHLAATKSSGTINANSRLYVNGDEVSHATRGPDASPSIIPAIPLLGHAGTFRDITLPERYWHGYLKDARIYPSALPAASIKTIYNTEW